MKTSEKKVKTPKKAVKTKTVSPKRLSKNSSIGEDGAIVENLKQTQMPDPGRYFAFQQPFDRYIPKVKLKRSPVFATCVPYLTNTGLSMDWCRSFKGIQGMLGCTSVEILVPDKDVATARNICVQQALQAGAEYIFFLGSDVLVPPDSLSRLVARDKDIVTGVYWTKAWPTRPYIWRGDGMAGAYMDWKYGEFFKIQYCGVDATMIKADVFKNLSEPWFSTDWNYDDQVGPQGSTTEDFYFYEKAAQAGYEFWCDSSIQAIHQDRNTNQMFGLTSDMRQMMEIGKYTDLMVDKVADVRLDGEVPLDMALMVKDDGIFHRFDVREEKQPDFRSEPTRLPSETGVYDFVNIDNVFEYFEEEQVIRILRECLRIIKTGGKFRITVPNPEKLDWKNSGTYKFKCGLDCDKFYKLLKLTKMAKGVKHTYTDNDERLQITGKIRTNRKWEILKEPMQNNNAKRK